MSFMVIADLASVATMIPQILTAEHVIVLVREGSISGQKLTIRSRPVSQAYEWLKRNNLTFYDELQHMKENGLLPSTPAVVEFTDGIIPISEQDEQVFQKSADAARRNSTNQSSADQDVLFLASSLLTDTTESSILEKLSVPSSLTMRRVPGFVSPATVERFYEKSFPCLFPYGRGGTEKYVKSGRPKDTSLKEDALVQLLLKRGGDRRFGLSTSFIFATYSARARRGGGSVAYLAAKAADAANPPVPAEPGAAVGDVLRRDPISAVRDCPTAADMVDLLSAKKGAAFNALLSRCQPYSSCLPGSAIHTASERRGLFAMMADADVRKDGELRVFNTISPADQYAST